MKLRSQIKKKFRIVVRMVLAGSVVLGGFSAYGQINNSVNSRYSDKIETDAELYLKRAEILIENGRYEDAKKQLLFVINWHGFETRDRSIANLLLASIFYKTGKLSDSIRAYELAMQTGGFNDSEFDEVRLIIAVLLIITGRDKAGAERLELYHQLGKKLSSEQEQLLFLIWAKEKRIDLALQWAEKICKDKAAKEQPCYQLLIYLVQQDAIKKQATELSLKMRLSFTR